MHWKLKLQKEFYVKFMKQIYFNNIEPKKKTLLFNLGKKMMNMHVLGSTEEVIYNIEI